MAGDFETGIASANPWGGVDEKGFLRVGAGTQLAVDDSGNVLKTLFSPSMAVGDLNGDGLPDLVVADARGYFWYFPNQGKVGAPDFSHPEIMPIWLSNDSHTRDVVPRIQLIDYDGDGKLDLVAGNYAGELYFIHNHGSASTPDFRMPTDPTSLLVSTHSGGLLWCNYLAPFLFDWTKSGRLDLIMGDGTYSANSIYLLTNMGNNFRPTFNEDHRAKIIAGMGREQLTPQVVDWNGDGKPDIISGERAGYIDVYLNTTSGDAASPTFAEPQHVLFDKDDKIGSLTTVCPVDLNQDKRFDLIVGSTNGHISYALNEGTPNQPKFGPLIPFKGTNPYPAVSFPKTWAIDTYRPYGAAYELLECTDAQKEPGFTPPPDFKGKGALKFSILDPHATYFKDFYIPDDNTRHIGYTGGHLSLQTESSYILSFYVYTTGTISNLGWTLTGQQRGAEGGRISNNYQGDISSSSSWSKYSDRIHIVTKNDKRNETLGVSLELNWEGDGTLYFDQFEFKKAP